MKERIQRVPFRDFANLSAEEREAAEQSKVNGKVVNIFRVMINHPPLARAWGPFGSYILSDRQTLSPRDREFAVLRIAWLNQSPYQFEQHTRISLELGITQAEIDRITEGPKAGWNEHDEALIQAADDLFEKSIVSDAVWKTLSSSYSIEQMMDLVFTIGEYNLASWAMNSLGVPLDDYLPGAKKS